MTDVLISRQAVLNKILKFSVTDGRSVSVTGLLTEVNELPPVTPQPKTGHWIEIAQYSDGNHKIECSECKSHIFDRGHANSFNVKNKYKYCPNCGCRMVEPQESEEV